MWCTLQLVTAVSKSKRTSAGFSGDGITEGACDPNLITISYSLKGKSGPLTMPNTLLIRKLAQLKISSCVGEIGSAMTDERPGLANETASLDSSGTVSGVAWSVGYMAGEAVVKSGYDG